jgi:hypothetical protein
MRNSRRIGGPFELSTGECDLDKPVISAALLPAGPANTPLDQQLQVSRTRLIVSEAVIERVLEVFEREMPRAACIGAIQEWTMLAALGHKAAGPYAYRESPQTGVNKRPVTKDIMIAQGEGLVTLSRTFPKEKS